MSFSGSQPAGRDFVGGSRFGQPSSDTYGGMNGGQMVMGSAMGAGGAQFGGGGFGGVGDFVGPGGGFQPAGGGFGSQTTGGGFGGGSFGQSQPDFGSQPAAAPLTRENLAVVPSPLPPAGGPFNVCVLASVWLRVPYVSTSNLDLFCISDTALHELKETNHVSITHKQTHNRCLGKHAHACRQTSQDTQTHTHIVYSLSLPLPLALSLIHTHTHSLSLSHTHTRERVSFSLYNTHTQWSVCGRVVCLTVLCCVVLCVCVCACEYARHGHRCSKCGGADDDGVRAGNAP